MQAGITHSDLRAVAEDIKRDNHASEQRLGERIDRLSDHVRALNGKTVTHGEAIADIKPRLRSVEKEVYEGDRRSRTPLIKVGLGGAGIGAVLVELARRVFGL
jgi:hypothetical protein